MSKLRAFQHMPLFRSASQLGCVISYVTFRSDVPPPANSRFGRVPTEGMTAAEEVAAQFTQASFHGACGELIYILGWPP